MFDDSSAFALTRSIQAIMVVGETGTGKTTIINGMMNYMLGVEWEDDFRLKLIDEPETPEGQANSQTSLITAYTVHRRAGMVRPEKSGQETFSDFFSQFQPKREFGENTAVVMASR